MAEELRIDERLAIPLAEIELRASRSSGPGGQHANVTASRVEAVFDVEASRSLDEARRVRLLERLGPIVTAVAQDGRGQYRNRELALSRLAAKIAAALRGVPPPPPDPPDPRLPPTPPRPEAPHRRAQAPAAARPPTNSKRGAVGAGTLAPPAGRESRGGSEESLAGAVEDAQARQAGSSEAVDDRGAVAKVVTLRDAAGSAVGGDDVQACLMTLHQAGEPGRR